MATLSDLVCDFLQHLGCSVDRLKSGQIVGSREIVGGQLTFAIRVEDRHSMSQLPAPSVYINRFENIPGHAAEAVKWVVVARDAKDASGRYNDFVRAMKELRVSVGTLDEFVDFFVPREQIYRWLRRKTDTLLHNVGYIPQHITTETSARLPAVETVLDWVESKGQSRLGLIHAPAGHGKTIFMERLAMELLRRTRIDKTSPTPFLVKFAEHRGADTIEELCMHVLSDVGRSDVPVDALKDLIRRGRVVLLFDGLDELSEEVGDRIGLENIRALADLIRRDSEGKVLVSCRSTFIESRSVKDQLLSGEHVVWELQALDEDDQRKFLEHNPPAGITGDDVNRHRDRVISFIHRNAVVSEFATSPFLLKQISTVVAEDQTALPKNMGDVYERFLLSLCERELVRQQHGISAERQLTFLREIAHEMVFEQVYSYPPDLFDMIIGEHFADEIRSAPTPAARKKELVAKLTGHAAFNPFPGNNIPRGWEIQFLHESMRDYGAASYLVCLLKRSDPDRDVLKSAMCKRNLPEGVVDFMKDALDPRGLATLGEVAQRTPPVMDNQNLFRIATSSEVPDASSLAFPTHRIANMNLTQLTVEDAALGGFNFAGSNLSGTQFVSCDLSKCEFEGALLGGTALIDSDLTGARFAPDHGVVRVDEETRDQGHDITAILKERGAYVGGERRRTTKELASRAHDGKALVLHVLGKFYNGTTPANARRRSRYDDVLERGRAGFERTIIRESVVPALESAGVLERSQRGAFYSLSVRREANAEVVNFIFRGRPSERLTKVVERIEQLRMTA